MRISNRIWPRFFLLFLVVWAVCVRSWVIHAPNHRTRTSLDFTFRKSATSTSSSIQSNPRTTHLLAASPWQSLASPHKDPFNAFKQLWYDVKLPGDDDNNDGENTSPSLLAFLFVSAEHADDFEALVAHAQLQFSASGRRIQCVSVLGSSVIGEGREWEDSPGISLLIGGLPEGTDAQMETMQSEYTDSSSFSSSFWAKSQSPDKQSTEQQSRTTSHTDACLVFADPWAPLENILHPDAPSNLILAGGISCPPPSFSTTPTSSTLTSSLALNGKPLPQGSAITVQFASSTATKSRIACQTVVAQGCRPASSVMQVTDCDGKVILELNGQPALKVLQQVVDQASSEQERELIQSQLLCGLAKQQQSTADESSTLSTPEDFVCRQIMGFVPSVQGIAIGTNERIDVGDWFCFQVRDATVAQKDLELMVQRAQMARLFESSSSSSSKPSHQTSQPLMALQISCVARGSRMFQGQPNVDYGALQQLMTMQQSSATKAQKESKEASNGDNKEKSSSKALPIAGFFANGEIGPIGLAGYSSTTPPGSAYLHSFTTVAIILSEVSVATNNINDGNDPGSQEGSTTKSDGESLLDAWG